MNKDVAPVPVTTRSGALRYIDAAAVRRGAASVQEFKRISLGLPIRHNQGPVAVGQQLPQHFMRRDGADYASGANQEKFGFGYTDDVIFLNTHSTTHVDALCSVLVDGSMFGGIPASQVSSAGARQLGAETLPPIATRALFVDAVDPVHDWLQPSMQVAPDQVEKALSASGIDVEPGDALLVRTGWVAGYFAGELDERACPGLSPDFAEWAVQKQLSIIGTDNLMIESTSASTSGYPLHRRLIRQEGLLFLKMMNLEPLRGRAVRTGLLTVNPIRITGGTASPVAPMLLV